MTRKGMAFALGAVLLAGMPACRDETSGASGTLAFDTSAAARGAAPAPPMEGNADAAMPESQALGTAFGTGSGAGTRLARPGRPGSRLEAAKELEMQRRQSEPGGPSLPSNPQAADTAAQSMLIRDGSASLTVKSVDSALAALRGIARRLGGHVATEGAQGGRERLREATVVLRIPSSRFDEAVSGLRPLGRLDALHINTQDVGEEYVDLAARLANARRLETRLVELLRTRTGRLTDVLAVERELARVREEIERYEGRMRFLRGRVAMSTLTVTVHEEHPIITPPGQNPIREAFRDAWRLFVRFLAGLIASLGVLIPLAAIGVAVWLVIRRHRRKGDQS